MEIERGWLWPGWYPGARNDLGASGPLLLWHRESSSEAPHTHSSEGSQGRVWGMCPLSRPPVGAVGTPAIGKTESQASPDLGERETEAQRGDKES